MVLSIKYYSSVLLLLMMLIMLPLLSYASSSLSCPLIKPFLHDLQLQCPTTIMYTWPIKMNGESLDNILSSNQTNAYVAILFYASWCPFSKTVQPKFDALSSMYPQIKHVRVEQSSVPPIVFSRYGIHEVPSILIANRTTRKRFHGPKNLYSLVHFYKLTTGLKPVMDLTEDSISFPENKSGTTELHNIYMYPNEPYLIFSLFFLFLKAAIYLYPNMVSKVTALWLAYIPHLNLAIFGESRQLLARVLQLVDFKRAFGKLKLIRSARAWTSSL
ncbi:5'-adenylylsulfate reductase-like 7 [Bidens hawaiensis]|uniref:5'-adenylylsulfate reductase-like 7 n=1 Tax=Bidens hawaiensis TaxID=980011 RepID=UPI00404B142B